MESLREAERQRQQRLVIPRLRVVPLRQREEIVDVGRNRRQLIRAAVGLMPLAELVMPDVFAAKLQVVRPAHPRDIATRRGVVLIKGLILVPARPDGEPARETEQRYASRFDVLRDPG